MDWNDDKHNRLNKAARDVLLLSRNTLLVNFRFLDMALSRLEPIPVPGSTLMTDGQHLGYDPLYVVNCFKREYELLPRDYLHVVLHCVFSHMFVGVMKDRDLWDLACDIAVENTINDLCLKSTESKRQAVQRGTISRLSSEIDILTAEKIYRVYQEKNLSAADIKNIRESFKADDHSVWYGESDPFGMGGSVQGNEEVEQSIHVQLGGRGASGDQSEITSDDDDSLQTATKEELAADWKRVSEKIQMDLESFSKEQGDEAGGMMQNLRAVNRERYDYTAFLKKFAVLGEAMKVNDEEFDYIFYTYGLKLYGNVPLIEPLEYKEVKRIREFVIAIDTSGSTSGALVQRFVQKTYNIMKSTESFFSKINVHIIQCDSSIQEHVKITSEEEFDEYLTSMTIHGLGGTSFRPVFEFVDDLIRAGEFTNLKGLIYFTDGWGAFPEHKPAYETAFVFLQDDYYNPDVPPWAIKLVLQSDEI